MHRPRILFLDTEFVTVEREEFVRSINTLPHPPILLLGDHDQRASDLPAIEHLMLLPKPTSMPQIRGFIEDTLNKTPEVSFGEEVANTETMEDGSLVLHFGATNIPAGIYFITLIGDSQTRAFRFMRL